MATVPPRILARPLASSRIRSVPSMRMSPVIVVRRGECSRISARNVTLLPEPDSPISATASPGATCSETPLTARMVLPPASKATCRSRTAIIGVAEEGAAVEGVADEGAVQEGAASGVDVDTVDCMPASVSRARRR
ncbi:hypothetical protein OJJOAM_004682 [Cupriavidus sp. H18C1]